MQKNSNATFFSSRRKYFFCTFNEVLLENSIKQHRLDIKDLNIMANRIKLFRTDYLEQEDCLRGSHILYSKFPPKIIF